MKNEPEAEIMLNLWYVIDSDGLIYSLRVRAYIGTGTDEEKMALLKRFAQVDYLIAKPFPIPERFQIEGYPVAHQEIFPFIGGKAALFEDAIQQTQAELPSQTKLNITATPMVCITALLGDDAGHIVPIVTPEE